MKYLSVARKYGARCAVVGSSLLSVAAFAEGGSASFLPSTVASTITQVQTDGMSLANYVWPVLLAFMGVALLMKLSKRFGNKI